MAAPSIRGSTAPIAGGAATSPAGTQIGDCVIVITWERAGAGVPTHTLQGGFSEIRSHSHDDGSTDGRLSVAFAIATAAGAQSYQAYTTSTGTPAWWTGLVVLAVGTFNATPHDATNSVTQTNNAVPNPAQVTGLDSARAYLVLAIAAWHLGSAATVAVTPPANYNEEWEMAGSNTGELSMASRSISGATSEDPGTFGDDVAPNGTCAITIAFSDVDSVGGTLSTTFGAVTVEGDAQVAVTGSTAKTFSAVTSEGDGTAVVAGALARTLEGLTRDLDGTVLIQGATAPMLTALTVAAGGTVGSAGIAGNLTQTLGALAAEADGAVAVLAIAAHTLGFVSLAADGALPIVGTVAPSMGALSATAAGAVAVGGTSAQTLIALALEADSAVRLTGTMSHALAGLALQAAGYRGVSTAKRAVVSWAMY